MDERRFSDEELVAACDLHVDNLRRLITWKAVVPLQAGGGRGRIRQWSLEQLLRVQVTAELMRAGYSLQMAHTLASCLPVDPVLSLYDPIEFRATVNPPPDLRRLHSPRSSNPWLRGGYAGSNVVVVDHRLVLANLLDDRLRLICVIDPERKIVQPAGETAGDVIALIGMIRELSSRGGKSDRLAPIARSSLLLDERVFRDPKRYASEVVEQLGPLSRPIRSEQELLYRSVLKVNLHTGLTLAFRRAMGWSASLSITGRD